MWHTKHDLTVSSLRPVCGQRSRKTWQNYANHCLLRSCCLINPSLISPAPVLTSLASSITFQPSVHQSHLQAERKMSNTYGTSGNSSSERNHDIPDPKGRFQAMRHSGILTDLTEIMPLSVSRGTLCDWCDHCLNRSRPIFWNMSRRCGEVENSAAQCQLCFILKELIKNADALYKGTVESADASLHNRFRSPPMGRGVPSGCLNVEFYISNPSKGTSCEIGNLMFIPAENQPGE